MSTSREEQLDALAGQLREAAYFCTKLEDLEIHCEKVAAELARLAATPKAGVDREVIAETMWIAEFTRVAGHAPRTAWPDLLETLKLPYRTMADAILVLLPSVLGGVDQQETQTTKPSPSSAAATATETALERIVRAWDLIVSGQPAAASEFVPQYVADNWAASFATFACDELRKATQCNEQSGEQLSQALEIIEQNCWDLRCVDIPTGADDADIGWQIIEHHMAPPKERIVGYGKSPMEALNEAMAVAPDNAGLVSGGGR